MWLFNAKIDKKVCVQCLTAENIEHFRGNNLRMNFPYLEIHDELTIIPNVHPNCRCELARLIL